MRVPRSITLAAAVYLALAGLARAEEPAAAPAYAGSDTCAACHPDQAESHGKTAHGRVLDAPDRAPAESGCEACHGPGQAHVDAGGGKGVGGLQAFGKSGPASERAAPCLRCHGGQADRTHFRSSAHALSGVACTSCHTEHAPQAEPLLRSAPPKLCTPCHLEVRAKLGLPEHHKVNEGVVGCLDCHAAHGSPNRAALRGTNNRECFRCHGDLEGPFVFEHEAILSEGCMRCHDPHGSTNRHLLARQQVAQLCYECHTVTPANHVQPSFRDCTRCHTAIHGSNSDPRFFEP
jgi:DmsE family decaheme c-type cytochrome